jgi:hypothetical protein
MAEARATFRVFRQQRAGFDHQYESGPSATMPAAYASSGVIDPTQRLIIKWRWRGERIRPGKSTSSEMAAHQFRPHEQEHFLTHLGAEWYNPLYFIGGDCGGGRQGRLSRQPWSRREGKILRPLSVYFGREQTGGGRVILGRSGDPGAQCIRVSTIASSLLAAALLLGYVPANRCVPTRLSHWWTPTDTEFTSTLASLPHASSG